MSFTTAEWRGYRGRTRIAFDEVLVAPSPGDAIVEPITLLDAQRHLKQPPSTPEDPDVQRWIRTARALVERKTRVACAMQTWDLFLDRIDGCPGWLRLPWWPVIAVDEFALVGPDGESPVDTNIAPGTYAAQLTRRPPILHLTTLPDYRSARTYSPLRLRLTVGFEDPAQIPPLLVQAMYLLVAYFSAHRGDETTSNNPLRDSGAQALIDGYILPGVA